MSGMTRIWTDIEFDADGKQQGCLRLPHSTDVSAYGAIPIPLIVIKNGPGPTALLVAGNHGDEYEGQLALSNLSRQLAPEQICGRIIILPALNYPAVRAGSRLSPLDGGNLNRLFPGNPHGQPSAMIAHYVTEVLLDMANLVLDLHSGGRSLEYYPTALFRSGGSAAELEKLIQLTRAFGAPVSCFSNGSGGGGATTLAAAAQARGIAAITAELGGGASLSKAGLDLAMNGTLRVLHHIGILSAAAPEPPPPTRLMTVPGRHAFIYADAHAFFEPAANPGDDVSAGQLAGLLHSVDWPSRQPHRVLFSISGFVACRRALCMTAPGDCLFKLAVDADSYVFGKDSAALNSQTRIDCGPSVPTIV